MLFTCFILHQYYFLPNYKLIVKFVKPGIIFIMNSLAIAAMVSFDAEECMLLNFDDESYSDPFAAIFC